MIRSGSAVPNGASRVAIPPLAHEAEDDFAGYGVHLYRIANP
jgi:hypothetical protein